MGSRVWEHLAGSQERAQGEGQGMAWEGRIRRVGSNRAWDAPVQQPRAQGVKEGRKGVDGERCFLWK